MNDKEKRLLFSRIEDKILYVADMKNEVTRSDLQGIATVTTQEIYNLVKKQTKHLIQGCVLSEKNNDDILKCIYNEFS